MRIEWKSERVGVARCPAEFKLLGEDEPAGTFEAYVAIFGTPDRPDFFGDSDVIEPGAFTRTLQEKGLPPIVWSHVWTIPPVGQSLQAVEDAKGLRLKARLFLDDDGISGQYARSIHTGMTATPPVVREFSSPSRRRSGATRRPRTASTSATSSGWSCSRSARCSLAVTRTLS